MNISSKQKQDLEKIIKKGAIHFDHSLKNLTSSKIGGPADVFIQTSDKDEIKSVFELATLSSLPFFVLGGGSNLIFQSEGYKGIVLKLPHEPHHISQNGNADVLHVSGGTVVNLVAAKLIDEGFSGFECMYGLPGTAGGAVYMNSKWPHDNYQTSDSLRGVDYLSKEGELVHFTKDQLHFSYGQSEFQAMNGIILGAQFTIQQSDKDVIRNKCLQVLAYRKETQPFGVFTAGCVFKNPGDMSAGYLIDQCGLKGYTKNHLSISRIHANFFVNDGKATSDEYLELIQKVKEVVFAKFGILLREEVLVVQ